MKQTTVPAQADTIDITVKIAALEQSLSLAREEWAKANREIERLKNLKSTKQLHARIEELEAILASRIYSTTCPNATPADIQAENIRLKETIASLAAKYENDIAQDRLPEDLALRLQLLTEERDETNRQFRAKSIYASELEAKLRHEEAANLQLAQSRNEWMENSRKLEKRLAEVQQDNKQAIATVQELLTERQTILADNCNLLSANREMQEEVEILQQKIEAAPQADELLFQDENVKISTIESQRDIANQQLGRAQQRDRWIKDLLANEHIESSQKVVQIGIAYAMEEKRDERGYTPLMSEEVFGRRVGLGRNAVGSNLRRLAQTNGLELAYGEAEIEVSNRGGKGKRKVKIYPISFKPGPLWDDPARLRKPEEVKKHGGFGNRSCSNCGREDWINVPHKKCFHCGQEEVKYPLTEKQKLHNEAVIEARQWDNVIRAQWEISKPGTPMVDAQAQNVEEEQKIEAAPQADELLFQDENVINHPAEEQVGEVVEEQVGEAQEETHEEYIARLNAETWREIEAKDPGCFVPANIIAYWKEHYGREYVVLHEREELPRPAPTPEPEKRKVANLRTGRIETVFV